MGIDGKRERCVSVCAYRYALQGGQKGMMQSVVCEDDNHSALLTSTNGVC